MAIRMTLPTLMILRALLEDPTRELYGLEIADSAGLLPGTTYTILIRLENEDWVTSRWEEASPHAEGRPLRRYYILTPPGAVKARAAVASARQPKPSPIRGLASEGGNV